MKKLTTILLFLITLIASLYISNVYAEDVSIESISIESKSDTAVEVNEATYSNLKINFDIGFTNKDDYIKYKVVINNKTNDDYEINNTKIGTESEYIKYEYSYDDNNKKIEKNKKTILYINIKYDKQVPDNLLLNDEPFSINNSIVINLGSEINPNTGRIIIKALILIILVLGISLSVYVNRIKNKTLSILLIGVIILPISVYALKQLSISVESKVTIAPQPHFYIGDDIYKYDLGMTWNEWLESDYNTINASKSNVVYYSGNSSNEIQYYYFENDEEGIIVDSKKVYCGDINGKYFDSNLYVKDLEKTTDTQNVTPNELIKNCYKYNKSIEIKC